MWKKLFCFIKEKFLDKHIGFLKNKICRPIKTEELKNL